MLGCMNPGLNPNTIPVGLPEHFHPMDCGLAGNLHDRGMCRCSRHWGILCGRMAEPVVIEFLMTLVFMMDDKMATAVGGWVGP
eukprot:1145051-Pelagomonas_calceolata.AAC.2